MQLNETRPNVEILGEMEEKFFSVSDLGMIFDILRNKLYSNPILAICREYSCNARDAHREVGKADLPIQITLPTFLEKYWKVKDWGPGISPDRMENIFIKYTASTKRNDNTQTGGFGIGSKTGFSYSDSFSIITIHNGIRYNYNCFIDPTKVGKLALSSQTYTDEPNGTEIIIPVQDKNFSDFINYTEQACRYWDIKPIIKGGELRFQEEKKILEGTGWAIAGSSDWARSAKVIVDGIEYPMSLDIMRQFADTKLIDAARGNFILYFGVGDLSLSANREQLFLDDKTKALLRSRMNTILSEVRQKVQDKVATFTNLWDANVYYRQDLKCGFSDISFLGKVEWQGVELYGGNMPINCTCFKFEKGTSRRRRMNKSADPNRLTRLNVRHLSYEEHSALYINDLPLRELSPRHVKKAFDDDPTLESVQVIVPNDTTTEAVLNTNISLDKMLPKRMSSITKVSNRSTKSGAARLIISKFDAPSCSFRQTSYAALEEETNLKVLCLLTKDQFDSTKRCILKNKDVLPSATIRSFINLYPGYSFYGLDAATPADRIEEDFSDCMDVDDFIEDQILNQKSTDYVAIRAARSMRSLVDSKLTTFSDQWKKHVTDPSSLLLQTLDLNQKVVKLGCSDKGMLDVYESLAGAIDNNKVVDYLKDHPDLDIETYNKELYKKYPLLAHFNVYSMDRVVPALAEYINLIDKKENSNV